MLAAEDGTDIDDPTLGTAMLYTSGTTGYPKGVAKPPDPDGLIAAVAVYQYRDGNVHLCTGPLYHAAPFAIALVPPLSCGVPVVMMERWDAEETLALDRGAPRDAHAPRADDVPPAALARSERCATATTSRRCGPSSTAPRRAPWR